MLLENRHVARTAAAPCPRTGARASAATRQAATASAARIVAAASEPRSRGKPATLQRCSKTPGWWWAANDSSAVAARGGKRAATALRHLAGVTHCGRHLTLAPAAPPASLPETLSSQEIDGGSFCRRKLKQL